MSTGQTFDLPLLDQRRVLSVSGLNREARSLIERDFGTVWVSGEISNLSRPSSGHLYWTLKDAHAQVRCAMFRQRGRARRFDLDNGQQVLVRARVSLYEARGDFQLIVDDVEDAGEGLLRRKFDELKRKLAAEGLFDAARKRPPPSHPGRIGVVTSPTGAAVRDVLTVLRRRCPAARVLIYPTAVQGAQAAAEISRTLALADRRRECDVLILARGGGSLEDLWAFNEEIVARTLSALETPVIVGVGHEVDFTIADFVADLRAPTPSQAAELAVPDQAASVERLDRFTVVLARAMRRRLDDARRTAATLTHRLERGHPGVTLRESSQRLDELEKRLGMTLERLLGERRIRYARLRAAIVHASPARRVATAAERCARISHDLRRAIAGSLERHANRLALAGRSLDSLSPLATLERGYAIVSRDEDGSVVTDSRSVKAGTRLDVRLAAGSLGAVVDRTRPPE